MTTIQPQKPTNKRSEGDERSGTPRGVSLESPKPRRRRWPGSLVMLVLLVAAVFAICFLSFVERTQTMGYHEFHTRYFNQWTQKYQGLRRARLQDDTLLIQPIQQPGREKSADARLVWYAVRIPETAIDAALLDRLASIPGFVVEPGDLLLKWLLYTTLPLVLAIIVFYFLVVRPMKAQNGPGSVLTFGRSRARVIGKDHTGVRFADVAGIEEAKEEVREVIAFLREPEKFERIGGRIPRGILFVGPPGTGKTLLAKAIAGEAEVPFFSISGSDFVEMFVGVGASRVRDLFRQAKERAPCIVFLDEVDAVGRRRGSGLGGGHDEREQTLNAILVEMDGFETNAQVIVIAATNRPDTLDPALLRPGRFDREVVINLPDVHGRYEILKVHARDVKISDAVDLMKIARATPMFSGAELEALVNEAAIRAALSDKNWIEQADLEEARDKLRFGRENRSIVSDEKELRETALHEAGHALLARLLPDVEPLHKVTVIPRGRSLGSTMLLPEKDRRNYTSRQLLQQIQVCFGGRIAEELCLGDISTGARQDIEQATEIARRMVCEFGMSQLGPIRFANKEQHVFLGGEVVAPREFGEATAERIDAEVKRILEGCYSEARELLSKNQSMLELIAAELVKRETLTAEDLDAILNEHRNPDGPS